MTTRDLEKAFCISQNQLELFLKDITAEMAGQNVGGGGNPVNWILGHILTERVEAIGHMGKDASGKIPNLDMYKTGSKPDSQNAIPYKQLKSLITVTFELLLEGFHSIEDKDLDIMQKGTMLGKPFNTGQLLFTYALHEMYHIGQISIARKHYGLS